MKALIFAAGLGTRLRPFTDTMPKALLPLAGHTLLEYQIAKLRAAGITDMIINVHHFADKIINFVRENDGFGCNISFSDERDCLLETGGGLRKAWNTFAVASDEPLLALNADILSTIRLKDVIAAYKSCECDGLLGGRERQTQRYLCFDEANRLVGWTNIATGEVRPAHSTFNLQASTKLAFSGLQILSPSVLPMLDAYAQQVGDRFSVIDFYLSTLPSGRFYACQPQGELLDVGKIDQLAEAEKFAKSHLSDCFFAKNA
jgi:NDP-sugar pyrophosphorylase family protein